MKLSEAIRVGAKMKPQGFGGTNIGGRSCALGAALDAIGVDTKDGWFPVYDAWPIAGAWVEYPGKCSYYARRRTLVGSACWLLNDVDKWTREQIADWVEALENADIAEPVAT